MIAHRRGSATERRVCVVGESAKLCEELGDEGRVALGAAVAEGLLGHSEGTLAVAGGVPGEEGSRPLVARAGPGPSRPAGVDDRRSRLVVGEGDIGVAGGARRDGEGDFDGAEVAGAEGCMQRLC